MIAPHVEATFEIVAAHLRAKGHPARIVPVVRGIELVCNGVTIRKVANTGIEVHAEHASGFIAVLTALSDLDIEQRDRRAVLRDIRHALAWLDVPARPHGSSQLHIDPFSCLTGVDCFDCFQTIELFDGCDLGCL